MEDRSRRQEGNRLLLTCLHAIYKTRATNLIHKLIALNYHRKILFTEFFSHTRCGYYEATATEYRQSQQVQKTYKKRTKCWLNTSFQLLPLYSMQKQSVYDSDWNFSYHPEPEESGHVWKHVLQVCYLCSLPAACFFSS